MKVLWTHNFKPKEENSGVFMYIFARGMRALGFEIDLHYLGQLNNPRDFYRSITDVAVKSANYDIVHAQYGSACSIVTSFAKCAKVLSLRGSDWYRYEKGRINYTNAHSYLAVAMSKYSLSKYDSIIVMSKRMRSDVLSVNSKVSIDVLPDPVDLNQFMPIDKELAREKLGRYGDRTRWILFTTLSINNPIKRLDLARKAVDIVRKNYGPVELKVASGVPHDQMPTFVASCDMALITSLHEGWPNCVKEALACNLPFVSTDVSDLSDIAALDSSCRICSDNPEEIANAIINALSAPKRDLRHSLDGMDIESTCGRLVKIYQRIVN